MSDTVNDDILGGPDEETVEIGLEIAEVEEDAQDHDDAVDSLLEVDESRDFQIGEPLSVQNKFSPRHGALFHPINSAHPLLMLPSEGDGTGPVNNEQEDQLMGDARMDGESPVSDKKQQAIDHELTSLFEPYAYQPSQSHQGGLFLDSHNEEDSSNPIFHHLRQLEEEEEEQQQQQQQQQNHEHHQLHDHHNYHSHQMSISTSNETVGHGPKNGNPYYDNSINGDQSPATPKRKPVLTKDSKKTKKKKIKRSLCLCEQVKGHKLIPGACARVEHAHGKDHRLYGAMFQLPKPGTTIGNVNIRERWLLHLGGITEQMIKESLVQEAQVRWTHFPDSCFGPNTATRRRLKKTTSVSDTTDPCDKITKGRHRGLAIPAPTKSVDFLPDNFDHSRYPPFKH